MNADSKSIRRSSSRFQAGLRALLHDGDESHRCSAHNLSRTGVLLRGAIPRPPSEAVEVTLMAPRGQLELRIQAETIRIQEDPEGNDTKIALAFGTLDAEQHRVLEALISRVLESLTPAPLEDLPRNAPVSEVVKALERIPVPHRISLAGRANLRERELLLHDPQLQVLDALARNPSLLPAEVHALAGLRDLLPSTLETIARDQRWQRDEDLKIVLATHPRAPLPMADRLLSQLAPPALRKVLQRPALNDTLRAKIVRKLSLPQ